MPLILVCNDDGVHAEGIAALAAALRPLGEVVVVAPDRERSAASHALTLHAPLRIREVNDGVFSVDGTPADCVYLGAVHVLERKPDLIVSGINHGVNVGDDVTYSGTIAAAIEGTILGVPSFAVSQEGNAEVPRGAQRGRFDFDNAGAVAHEIATRVLADGLPSDDILLNINVPAGAVQGVRCTRQGKRTYDQVVHEGTDPRGMPYYWIGSGAAPHAPQDPDTDYMAVHNGYVSICPLHLDLTHYPSLRQMQEAWGDLERGLATVVEG
ncbi:MAG: 5'/3'-nucleotidase SurE [Acidobacteriota bacterium]|jgi:5'-nucleotidase